MVSRQHQLWINRGRPAQLALPLRALRDYLRALGYTVYDIGNDAHLDHQPPEDHTPYSETGWPGTSPYGWILAIDVMPPSPGRGLPSLQVLGSRLMRDRQEGRAPWIKYMNWGPDTDAHAVQDRWTPTYTRRPSTDTGHLHLSQRTDYVQSTEFDQYDPFDLEGIMAGLIDNAERAVTAFYTGADPVTFPAPWPGAEEGLPNPFVRLERKVDALRLQLDKVLEVLQHLTAPEISQVQVDAALAAGLADLRLETRVASPGGA